MEPIFDVSQGIDAPAFARPAFQPLFFGYLPVGSKKFIFFILGLDKPNLSRYNDGDLDHSITFRADPARDRRFLLYL
jgi:hypothetical protein